MIPIDSLHKQPKIKAYYRPDSHLAANLSHAISLEKKLCFIKAWSKISKKHIDGIFLPKKGLAGF